MLMLVSAETYAGLARWGKIAVLSARIPLLVYSHFLMLGKSAKRAVPRYEFKLSDRAVQSAGGFFINSWKKTACVQCLHYKGHEKMLMYLCTFSQL